MQLKFLPFVILWTFLTISSLSAQDPDLQLSLTSDQAVSGTTEVTVLFTNSGPLQIAGWSYGICHPAEIVEIVGIALGDAAATSQGGSAPEFENTAIFPGEGWTTGVVIDFFGVEVLQGGMDLDFNVATYELLGVAGDVAEIDFCPTLGGAIPVDTIITSNTGAAIVPTATNATISILEQNFRFAVVDQAVPYQTDGTASFTAEATIEEDPSNFGYPNPVGAFSMSLVFDDSILVANSAVAGSDLAAVGGGAGPDYFGVSLYPNAVTLGVVISFDMLQPLAFDAPLAVAEISYDTVAAALAGNLDGLSTSIDFAEAGDPVVKNLVIDDLVEITALLTSGEISLEPAGIGALFIRGDINVDGLVDISDAVMGLAFMFQGETVTCLSAVDVNDDGQAQISDAVYQLSYLFTAGPIIPEPFPFCGSDPTDDLLTCDEGPFCL